MIKWHRLFGITLTDFFSGTAYKVELEKDLSMKQQLLDVVIIEEHEGMRPEQIPDGFENLGKYNLLTYKSHQQALDAWALDELTGHYVNYRKMISPSSGKLIGSDDFRLYGVSARYPENLKKYAVLKHVSTGVYEIRWGSKNIRLIVLSRVPKQKKNAMWNLFSAVPDTIKFGFSEYKWRTQVSSIMTEMLNTYKTEGVIAMTYTVEDYYQEYALEHITEFSVEEILEKISIDELMKKASIDERLKDIPIDEVLKNFSKEELVKWLKKMDSDC
ncbi:hypothetical protein QUF70_03945 [Desulfobacterales bacterium HSG17]|nr:hypothetical protein [Desulfobacterales bacterium HSG17]